ncbi:MAG: flagellar motor stator protein MotA, partial [Acidobacteriia bacterium]|nr:flagellar motor stator protein MotA [Terriglobia bacterium]
MLALVGIALVFAAVFGGYILESGNPYVLLQPAELLIIGGAATGIVLVANPLSVIRKMARGVARVFRPPPYTCASLLERLRMLYEVFAFAQRAGIIEMEQDFEDPARSRIFSRYPEFVADPACCFVCDSLRMLVIGATTPYDLDRLMDLDIEVQRRGGQQPVSGLSAMADSLPGLGIVAAVLGVVITMEAIGGEADKVGQKIAAALVGTFLGILLCYGVVGPLAARLEHLNELRTQFLQVLRVGIISFARGASLADPRGLFNSSLDGNTRRAIDIREGEVLAAGRQL